mmetsp:Transcript_15397/g.35734  ORF Transcript_15397/g.35734 Transcript_15397/m.35734 type:complete len:227 (-) Transcript_15397:341-1021(-)
MISRSTVSAAIKSAVPASKRAGNQLTVKSSSSSSADRFTAASPNLAWSASEMSRRMMRGFSFFAFAPVSLLQNCEEHEIGCGPHQPPAIRAHVYCVHRTRLTIQHTRCVFGFHHVVVKRDGPVRAAECQETSLCLRLRGENVRFVLAAGIGSDHVLLNVVTYAAVVVEVEDRTSIVSQSVQVDFIGAVVLLPLLHWSDGVYRHVPVLALAPQAQLALSHSTLRVHH